MFKSIKDNSGYYKSDDIKFFVFESDIIFDIIFDRVDKKRIEIKIVDDRK